MRLIELLANLYDKQGRFDEAMPCMAELISIRKSAAERQDAPAKALNESASLLLTCEPNDLRDPEAVLATALRANEMTGHKIPMYLDTLALAYHLNGDTVKAIYMQEKAVALLSPGTASAGGVDALVTGDADLLDLKRIGEAAIISPRVFYDRLK